MNGINIKAISAVMLGLFLGLYVMVEVITARAGIGQFYLYVAIAAFFMGVFAPRAAMYLLAFCTVYIDVFKRMMVIGGYPTFLEVSYVLAIPPLLVLGSLSSLVASLAFSRERISRDVIISFMVSTFIALASVVGVLTSSSDRQGLGKVGVMVNQGFYAYLIFIVPLLFPSDEERRKYLHYLFVLMIPSVFYMFWQAHFGYADYEYAYLMTGLTIEGKNLTESFGGELRSFSTFNGCGTASTIYSIFLIFCFVPFRKGNQKPSGMQKWGKLMLAPLFMIAAYFTISRTGWFCGLGTLAAYLVFGSRLRARLGVLTAVGSYVLLIAFAPMIQKSGILGVMEKQMQYTASKFTNDPTVKRAIVLGTMGDRIQGWVNLTQDSRIWQPFGFAASGMDPKLASNNGFSWGHDAVIDTLIKFGYIPLFTILCISAYLLSRLLQYMYSLPKDSIAFKTTRLCLALIAGILVGAMSSGAQFRNFPQNYFFALWIAIPFAAYQQAMREKKNAAKRVFVGQESTGYPALPNAARVGMTAQQ